MAKKPVDLKKLLPSQAKEESKKHSEEMAEELDVLGQESEEGAVKWVQEKEKEAEHAENEKSAEEQWKLHDAKKKFFTYKNGLLQTIRRRMVEYDEFVPKGFMWIAKFPDNPEIYGLEVWIRDPKDKFYCKAMKICGDPMYDLNWIDNAIHYGLNQMDEIDQSYKREASLENKFVMKDKNGKKIYI